MSSNFGVNKLKKKITCQRTFDRLEIINLLVEYRSLTTRQINTLMQTKGSSKTLRRIQSDLQTLKLAGMVQSFPVSPEMGPRSEMSWILLKPGVSWAGLELRYGNHFRRQPSPEQVVQTTLKLELEKAVASSRGWQLERPRSYNRVQPLPARTPQYYRLAEALTWREFFASGRWPVGGIKGSHTLGVPFKANDFLAYSTPREIPAVGHNHNMGVITKSGEFREETSPGGGAVSAGYAAATTRMYSEQAVVFILCSPKASQTFWLSRIREYQQIAKQLLVVGVFESEDKALNHKELLLKGNLRVTTLSRIRAVLEDTWKP